MCDHRHTYQLMEYLTLLEVESLTTCLSTFLLISAFNWLCNMGKINLVTLDYNYDSFSIAFDDNIKEIMPFQAIIKHFQCH